MNGVGFAAQSAQFRRALAHSPRCTPSQASLHSSHFERLHGFSVTSRSAACR